MHSELGSSPLSRFSDEQIIAALGLDEAPEDLTEEFMDQWLMSITDREGRIVRASTRFCNEMGFSVEEVLGRNHRIFSSGLHSTKFFDKLWSTILADRDWCGMIVNRSRSGLIVPLETVIRTIKNAEGEVIGFMARRQVVELGEVEGHQFRLQQHIFDQLLEGVLIVDNLARDTPIVYVNSAWCKMTGYSPQEAIGRNPRFLQGPDTSATTIRELRAAIRRGDHYRCEVLNYRKTGSPFWNRMSVSPFFDDKGLLMSYIAISSDVTERRAGQMMLDLENSHLEMIARDRPLSEICESLLQLMCGFISNSGGILYVEDPPGSGFRMVTHSHLELEVARVVEQPEHSRDDPLILNASTQTRPIVFGDLGEDSLHESTLADAMRMSGVESVWVVPLVRDTGGSHAMVIFCFSHPRHPSEVELKYIRLGLNLIGLSMGRANSQRVRETLDRKLRQSQKMEAIGTLAGGIAHDFNNILGGIFGFLHLARDDIGPDHPADQWIGEIDGACKRARDLVKQLLTFSRSDELARAPLKLTSVMKDASKLVRASLPSSVSVTVKRTEEEIPEIMGDYTQIQLAVLNLCTNSWQSMENGKGKIEIRVESDVVEAPNPGTVRVIVTDNGSGIAPEDIDRIFDPFFSTKPVGVGTGLGLSVVHGIMSSHDGRIWVESEEGKGSSFTLEFPALQPEEVPKDEPSKTMPLGNGEGVLFIDDEMAIVTWSQLILERIGYRVEAFTDPSIGLETLEKRPEEFDLVVTDFTMPNVSGLDVIRKVKELCPNTPVILMSGHGVSLNPAEIESSGAVCVLHKPVGIEDLAASLRNVLTSRQSEE